MSETPLFQVYVGKHPYWEPVRGFFSAHAVMMAAMKDFGKDAVSVVKLNDNEIKRSEIMCG